LFIVVVAAFSFLKSTVYSTLAGVLPDLWSCRPPEVLFSVFLAAMSLR